MSAMIALLFAAVGCVAEPPPPPAPPPAPAGPPLLAVSADAMSLDGLAVDATLDPHDERRIPALYERLLPDTEVMHISAAPTVAWRPLRRAMLTASARGAATFMIGLEGGTARGPVALPAAAPAPLPGPPRPIVQLHVHQATQAWVDATLRFRGFKPADCDTVFSEPALREACAAGGAPSALSLGCLVQPASPGDVSAWSGTLAGGLGRLGAAEDWSWVVLVDTGVQASVLDAVLAGVAAARPSLVSVGGASPTRGGPAACGEPDVADAAGVAVAGARWLGSAEE